MFEQFSDWMKAGAALSALVTVLGALVAVFAKRALSFKISGIEVEFQKTADPTRDSRLTEVREALDRQESVAKWNGRATASLTFGQYIVGGILASSFVQESLSTQVIGVLGVLVLLSSLIHQRYRPDLQASGAKHRAFKARTLIRTIEDDLFALKNGQPDAPSIYDIRKRVSVGLAEIEGSELIESERASAEATSA